jgi:hypothetical protein
MEEYIQKTSEKTVSESWNSNIVKSLEKLQDYEILAKQGCETIFEYIQIPLNTNLDLIQEKNYRFFMTEFSIILSNTKHLMTSEQYKNLSEAFLKLQNLEKSKGGFLITKRKYEKKEQKLSKDFFLVIEYISKLREDLISALWRLLSPRGINE